MAVSKVITYADSSGNLLTSTISIDVQKLAVGEDSDEEKVFLVLSAPGIASKSFWRREIEGLVEDGIFASSGVDSETRFPVYASGEWTAYGDKITNSGIVAASGGIPGIRQQLLTLAG